MTFEVPPIMFFLSQSGYSAQTKTPPYNPKLAIMAGLGR
jgi:hypothetical protein